MEVIVGGQPAGQMFIPFPAQASICQQYEETWISSNQARIQHKYNSSVKTFILHLKHFFSLKSFILMDTVDVIILLLWVSKLTRFCMIAENREDDLQH